MAEQGKRYGARFERIDLTELFNWPEGSQEGEWWEKLAERVCDYPEGEQSPWGIPFRTGSGSERRVLLLRGGREATVELSGRADYLCLLHEWRQLPDDVRRDDPAEGLVVGEYEIEYADGTSAALPARGRFEVAMEESPGPPWLAQAFHMWEAVDPTAVPNDLSWGGAQTGLRNARGEPLVCAMPNPHPDREIQSLTFRGLHSSPLIVAGLTLCRGSANPLRHLPRRTYRVTTDESPPAVESAEIDLGGVARLEESGGPPGEAWLGSPYAGLHAGGEEERPTEKLIEAFGAVDATVSVKREDAEPLRFCLGEAFHDGESEDASSGARLRVLGRERQWMDVVIRDGATGRPTPVRLHIEGEGGEYVAPYGHHSQVNAEWFEDYGADVVAGGRQYAYVPGEFRTDLPVGDLYVEINKGFEYAPIRRKVTVRPGQQALELEVERSLDWRSEGWVTADTHVHFVSPHTAWLEGQAEGVNVVNLLASQWGRLFTNVGDYIGGANVVGDDTIVYVGTENRNHMLGHMSMLGTKGKPVFPMCCGGPSESFVGDPDLRLLAEWARENKRKGGLVIRPHFPYCGFTEDPVPILRELVDALEVRVEPGEPNFATQEWYRYLNCGYRVAVVGGTDKMGAYCPIGWLRTYARIDPGRPLDYESWAEAVRAGRTFSTNGPLIDMKVDGRPIGETIRMGASGGTVEVQARAKSVWPLERIQIVRNGRVVAEERASDGALSLQVRAEVEVPGSGWVAARCSGREGHASGQLAAHTSPVYLKCGETRAFDGAAAQHMLGLVEGGIEYLNKLATVFDESSRRRMVKMFKEARRELKGRLLVEADHHHHPGEAPYHTHGHDEEPGHTH